ncbi:MAG: hypothetical protein DIU78_003090 [Pseudomonadota bacterium]
MAAVALGCGDDPRAPAAGGGDGRIPTLPGDRCAIPAAGCPCENEGQEVECGKTEERYGDYLTCSVGTRTCTDGEWSACVENRKTRISSPRTQSGRRALSLGTPAKCPDGFDPCDPYCNLVSDAPDDDLEIPEGFESSPSGLTLVPTIVPECDSLELTPSTETVHLTGDSLTTLSAPPVTFTLKALPEGCVPEPFAVTWTIDRFDRATITGNDNTDGALSVALPIAGPIKVTAFAAGVSTSTTVNVKVNVLQKPTNDSQFPPNSAASSTQRNAFGTVNAPNPGTEASTATWLYPYENTYFPLALPPPVAQYRYTRKSGDSTSSPSAVKLSLRYPPNTTPTDADYNYSIVVEESNAVVCDFDSSQCNFLDPQIVIPELAWSYLEQTARGNTAELTVQRLRRRSSGSDVLEQEARRRIHFVDGQLKGTVYYNSYTSPQGGNTGAILAIRPGAKTPTLAVQPSGTCSTCHSINLDGTRLITNGGKTSGGGYDYDTSKLYDMTTPGPSPTVLKTYTNNRFTFGGPWVDGSFYMSHGGGADPAWHAPTGASKLYRPNNPDTALSLSGWPSDIQAVTPRFSPDGTKLAFGFWAGSTLSRSPSGTLGSKSDGTRLVVVDFTCSSPPCTGSSTGWKVSNARDLTPGIGERVAWPSFTPDGSAVVYQRQYRSSQALLSWTPSHIGTIGGALAELWISKVPSNGSTTVVPTRLSALNGLKSDGTSYLPQQARTLVDDSKPLYVFPTSRHHMIRDGSGPDVVLTGTPTSEPMTVEIDMRTSGSRGSAKFRWRANGGSWSGDLTTDSSVTLGSTGLRAEFASGTYNSSTNYSARVGVVGIQGTPQNGPWDVRIWITRTGNRGTARFKYSTDGGAHWSGEIPTGASVSLGDTGLVATFRNESYGSTSAQWGAYVTHYHENGARFYINQADNCTNNAVASDVYDYRMNYLPSIAPAKAGGKSWVVFTSRRMYGNIAYEDPWDAEPGYGCYSGKIPSKKLWIAAIDEDWTPGSDPSHPAFYLPGQELGAGNSDGYWVSEPCAPIGESCEFNDDCCDGTGASATTMCRVVSTASFPPTRVCASRNACGTEGESCASTSECCPGLVCPDGGGLCVREPPKLFETLSYSREYVAECPAGTAVAWRFFEWQATLPPNTSIQFFVETKGDADDTYRPEAALLAATATTTTPNGAWDRGETTVNELLRAEGIASLPYLRVTMTFNPNPAATAAPTLNAWRQIYDCVPAE